MTSDRCYRKALSFESAYAEIRRCSGTQFDPKIVRVFLSVPAGHWKLLRSRANMDASSGWEALCSALRTAQPHAPATPDIAGDWPLLT